VKSRVCGILIACLMVIIATRYSYTADEVDNMLIVETPVKQSALTNDLVKPAETPSFKPVESEVVLPTAIIDSSTIVAQPVVTNQPVIAPPQPVVVPEPVAALQTELMLREQELAKANREVERLKDIVRKIQDANRRESLVFHYNMAAIYRSNMLYKKAEEAYVKALEIDPRDAGVHYNLAILYDDNFKDKKKAKYHYERFLELAPEDPDAPKVREWLSSIL